MRLSGYDQWKLDCGPDDDYEDMRDRDTSDMDLDPSDDGPNPDDLRDEARDRAEWNDDPNRYAPEDDWNE